MRLVPKPFCHPHHCVALPHVGQTSRTRWIDTGAEIAPGARDAHVYVSEAAFEQMAALLGYVPSGELRALQRTLDAKVAELRAATAEAVEMRAAWDAVDVIERHGMTARPVVPA